MAQFGDLLAELRQDRGLTQSELGKVISVTSGTISNYEHGFHLPDLEKLVLLADYFGVSTDNNNDTLTVLYTELRYHRLYFAN